MSPPAVFSSISKRSVLTMTGSPVAAGAAAVARGAVAEGVDGVGAERDAVGVGMPVGADAVAGAGCRFGALCLCHASHSRSAENEKTMSAMSRWVSIMGVMEPDRTRRRARGGSRQHGEKQGGYL